MGGTTERIFEEPEVFDETLETEADSIPTLHIMHDSGMSANFIELDSPDLIVNSSIDSHILVNAGPGTGKTYTVIERLAYIIDSGMVNLGQVLVLCYTNAARDVILTRLGEKGMAVEARQLVICTLDSLAWSNLSEKTEDDLYSLGFNGCIQRFIEEFDENEWSGFEYVIVDELQDLVNERAHMTLKILKALRCGYLLLGDKCQAIYDYECSSENASAQIISTKI